MTIEAENNDRAVVLSEEVDWLEELAADPDIPAAEVRLILDRRDIVRDSILTDDRANPRDRAEEGFVPVEPPEGLYSEQEADPDDAVRHEVEPDDPEA